MSRLFSFRSGDRSEYLALFGLSRVAFVCPAARQEDFGVADLFCILTSKEGKNIYPENAFYVQVKSPRREVPLKRDAVNWIRSHMALPLLVCISDKKKNELRFYSCSNLWFALFLHQEPSEVVLDLHGPGSGDRFTVTEVDGGVKIRVLLGPPILRQSIAEIEEDPSTAFSVLKAWIVLDAENIVRRDLGRIAIRGFQGWETNRVPREYFQGFNPRADCAPAEAALVEMLTGLGHNYLRAADRTKFDAVRGLLTVLPDQILNEDARKMVRGEYDLDQGSRALNL